MQKVLVAGATGTTGKKVVKLLKESVVYEPIAMVRKEEQAAEFEKEGIETRMGDLEKNIDHVTEDIHKVIFAAGSGGKKVYEVDQEGAKKLVDASKQSNIDKFVMLSSKGAENPEQASDLQDYLKAKRNADEYLRASSLPYTILRPGALTNDDGTGLIQAKDRIHDTGSISRSDVAETLVELLDADLARGKTFEILSGETDINTALRSI